MLTHKRINKKYLAHVRTLPCHHGNGCMGEVVYHHVMGAPYQDEYGQVKGGVGMKTADRCCIPLCVGHHNELHQIGEKRFFRKYNLGDPAEEAKRYFERWK